MKFRTATTQRGLSDTATTCGTLKGDELTMTRGQRTRQSDAHGRKKDNAMSMMLAVAVGALVTDAFGISAIVWPVYALLAYGVYHTIQMLRKA